MINKNVRIRDKQQNVEKGDAPFEKMLDVVFNDMQSRHTDPEVQKMKDIYNEKLISLPNMAAAVLSPIKGLVSMVDVTIGKRVKTYPQIYENFKSGGKWDHKVQGKEILDSYYSKQEKNKDGQAAVVFGGKIPGDDKHIYDHDFWGNISYGYTLSVIGLPEIEIRAAAVTDDIRQIPETKDFDTKDDDMVAFGITLYKKYGDKLTKEDLRREIIANKDRFRRYTIDSLEKRSIRAKDGDTLEEIAKREGVSVKDIQKQLDKDAKQNAKLYGNISDQMSLKEGMKINLPRPEERERGAVVVNGLDAQTQNTDKNSKEAAMTNVSSESKDGIDSTVGTDSATLLPEKTKSMANEALTAKILEYFQKNDSKLSDVLLKPSTDITYDEIRQAQKEAMFDIKDMDLLRQVEQKVKHFYQTFFGNDKVQYDEMGRMVQPQALMPVPEQSKEVMTKDKIPVSNAFRQLAGNVADNGAKALQKGLNMLGFSPALKEDGIIGPKTVWRTKEALANNGLSAVKKNVNIGAFENMVEDNRRKEIPLDTLKNTVSKIGTYAGKTLQKGLNAVGQNKENFEPLKEDNEVGPKTTSIFNQFKDEEEERIKTLFRPEKYVAAQPMNNSLFV